MARDSRKIINLCSFLVYQVLHLLINRMGLIEIQAQAFRLATLQVDISSLQNQEFAQLVVYVIRSEDFHGLHVAI